MAASHTLPQSHTIRKSGVLVLNGYGIRVQVNAGHLTLHDGIADERRTIRLPRVNHGLKRLVMIGSDGFVTLEALRWISDVGAAFVMLDRRGKVLAITGPVSPSDAKLRRAQALALGNGTALKISRELISQKLAGQNLLVRDMLRDSASADTIARYRAELSSAASVESVRLIEAQAARAYWQVWSDLPILWPRKDEHRVPEHWKRFGSRISPLTHSPRLAANPPNALLNLLYALLESESRLSAAAMGLDPGIGLLHVDTSNRDSLACDIMEVCRPKVDAFVLNWLQSEPLCKSDFWEDRNGNCRIGFALAIKLCETADTWRRLVAPVAEYVAQEICSSVSKPASQSKLARQVIATRLTQRNKREVKGSDVPGVKRPKPEHVCGGCGKPIKPERNHCANCAIDGATDTPRECRANWAGSSAQPRGSCETCSFAATPRTGVLGMGSIEATSMAYERSILAANPTAARGRFHIRYSVTDWSFPLVRGPDSPRYRPHPRHWLALAKLAGVSAERE